jgi:hypothetical protein
VSGDRATIETHRRSEGAAVEVKIGVQSVPREIAVETPMTADEVEDALRQALGTGDGVLRITSDDGGHILVPVDKLGYVEIGTSASTRIGF